MFRESPKPLLRRLIAALAAAIFLIDAFTALDVAIAALYVSVVLLGAQAWGRRGLLAVVAACLALTILAYLGSHSLIDPGAPAVRCLVSLAAIGITGLMALAGQAATNELRQREESLRLSKAFLACNQRICHTGSFRYNVRSGRMQWSEEAARIFGVAPSATPSVTLLQQRIMPADAELLRRAMERGVAGDSPIDIRHRLLMPDGAVKQVRLLAHASVDAHGAREYLAALMDVTAACEAEQAQHRALAQLAHATRVTTLGQLTASIAHEVNQPLAAISMNGKACLRWLDRPEPDLDKARAAVKHMLEACLRAVEVIGRLRAMARKDDPEQLPVDLNEVAGEAAALLQCELASQEVTLALSLAAGLPPVLGDRVQLQQVVINLLMNGMQANAAQGGGALRLQTQWDDGGVTLSVSDTGPGIREQDRGRMFEAFYTTKPDGMGMGLPICRSIIEAHGGRIDALAGVAKGATVAFSLSAMQVKPGRSLCASAASDQHACARARD
jgi:signal transduction histidine kinase